MEFFFVWIHDTHPRVLETLFVLGIQDRVQYSYEDAAIEVLVIDFIYDSASM